MKRRDFLSGTIFKVNGIEGNFRYSSREGGILEKEFETNSWNKFSSIDLYSSYFVIWANVFGLIQMCAIKFSFLEPIVSFAN